MANTHATLGALFTDIADNIRIKTGVAGEIVADNFPAAIASIPVSGGGENPYQSKTFEALMGYTVLHGKVV